MKSAMLTGTGVLDLSDLTSASVVAFEEFGEAARAFRDAELALQAAQKRYRAALDALNRVVAPVETPTGEP